MSYTIKNLREVEDVAPKFGFDAVQEARFCFRDLDAKDTGMAYHRVKPGQRGLAHRHDNAEEIYVVLAGSGRVKLDDEIAEIGPLDAIRVELIPLSVSATIVRWASSPCTTAMISFNVAGAAI